MKNEILTKKNKNETIIVTALIESNENYCNKSRLKLLEDILPSIKNADIVVLPAGFIKFKRFNINNLNSVELDIRNILNKIQNKFILCFGIDTTNNELGIAISSDGILAIGRKFYPTKEEIKNKIFIAPYVSEEKIFGYERSFMYKNKKYFIAICYDVFGIKYENIPKQDTSIIINLIHGFYPKKDKVNSGDVYFARDGLGGASKQWHCPVFGSAIFFNRNIPINWPSGVIWNKGNNSTRFWSYKKDNPLKPFKEIIEDKNKNEKIILKYYKV